MAWRERHFDEAGRPKPPRPPFEWPADRALERIEAISVNARTTWFALLGLLTFVLVTLLGVEDIDFFGYDRATQLPLIGVSVPTVFFFIAAPALTAAVYAYFHFYLMKLWDALGRAPARIDGDALGDRIHPWLVSDAALLLRRGEGAAPDRALKWISAITSAALTWGFGWVVLGYAWLRSFPAHQEWLSLLLCACFFFSLWVGLTSLVMVWRRIRRRAFAPSTHLVWRSAAVYLPATLVVCLGFAFTWLRTEGDFEGAAIAISDWRVGEAGLREENYERRAARHAAALPDWMRFTPPAWPDLAPASLREARIVAQPADWADREIAERAARRRWCDLRDRPWALCVREPDARQRAAREAWCVAPENDALDLANPACDAYFDGEENAFQSEWRIRRRDMIDILGKPILSGRDLRGARMANAFLPGVQLDDARLDGADLWAARLEEASLRRAWLRRARLGYVRLEGADLVRARLDDAYLADARLQRAQLRGATLDYANFGGARLEGASLAGARARGADFARAFMDGAALNYAKAAEAYFAAASLVEADLDNLEGPETNFSAANLSRADISGATLTNSVFISADLEDARLLKSNFSRSLLMRARFRGARLDAAIFEGAVLFDVDFSGATNLTQAQLDDAVGGPDTILPADASTGAPLFVWSCWLETPFPIPGPAARARITERFLKRDWLCGDAPRIKTGLSAATGFRQGFSLRAGRGL